MSTESATGGLGFDPTECDRMTIHEPGLIQPHGVLLVLRPDDLVVVQVSANTGRWLGIEPDAILGRPLTDVLGTVESDRLAEAVRRDRLDAGPRFALTLPARGDDPPLDVTAHANDGLLLLELEPAGRSLPTATDPYSLVRDAVMRLQSSSDVPTFCQTVADEIGRISEFDRVMVYRFAGDASGRVIAECRRPDLVSYLDKRFPAGDVPRPARELMARNWLRLVPNVDYEPVPLAPTLNPVTGRRLDMSFCLLRHSSRMCTTYLRNMGTACQMVMPLLRNGELWGLVSCHHSAPRYVAFPVRAACEVLAQVASLQIATAEDRETFGERLEMSSARDRLVAALDESDDLAEWLLGNVERLADYVLSDGMAVRLGDRVILLGRTPAEEDVRELFRWITTRLESGLFATDSLASQYPPGSSFVSDAAGVLHVDFGPHGPACVAWFRREHVETVTWAGDPRKPVETGPLGEYLSPRRSFERWAEAVRGNCIPWRRIEVEGGNLLRDAVLARLQRRSEHEERLRAELEAGRQEIDSFVYVASHDLKEPLRGIHKYAHILIENCRAKLDTEERQRLDGLVRLTDRMSGLIESLLHLSRVGRLDLEHAVVDLAEVAREALDVTAPRTAEWGAEVRVGNLPKVSGDVGWLREVFVNLITNALKYNDKSQKIVEIGRVEPPAGDGSQTIFVRDNGIGIAERHKEAVFSMFKRLHGRDDFGGGTGAGLAIVRKIIERHGGRIWVESTPGVGSTFYFTLSEGGRES